MLDLVFEDMKRAFYAGVEITDHGLEWITPSGKGYGRCSWTTNGFNIQVRAHRVAWMLENGSIPEGYVIDHDQACPKTCVTASHLQALSISEHSKLGWKRGELSGGWEPRIEKPVKPVRVKRERIHPPKPEPFLWKIERECKNCTKVFIPNTSRQVHCSSLCSKNYKETSRGPRRYPRLETSTCQWCEKDFKPKRKDSMFCSRKCIDANQNNKKKLRKEQ